MDFGMGVKIKSKENITAESLLYIHTYVYVSMHVYIHLAKYKSSINNEILLDFTSEMTARRRMQLCSMNLLICLMNN